MPKKETSTAAVLVIGDEILSGRTQDTNSNHIARVLTALGIDLKEVRVVGDVQAEIVAALNALRDVYDFVFTTGGIGPTHDDITADAVAARFRRRHWLPSQEVYALLEARYPPGEFNEMRKRMARIPHGAGLVTNPVSAAPGFHIGNVYVLAGVPMVMRAHHDGTNRARAAAGDVPRFRALRWKPIFPKAPSRLGCWRNCRKSIRTWPSAPTTIYREAASRSLSGAQRDWCCAAAIAKHWSAPCWRLKTICENLVLHRSA